MKSRRTKIFDGKCYNFSLLFVQDWLLEHGKYTSEEAITLSSRLSEQVKGTVKEFFERLPVSKI